MKDFFDKLFPPRSRFAIIVTVATNFLVYYGALLINKGRVHYQTAVSFDDYIPFLTYTVIIYFGAFLQWAVNYFFLSENSEELCYTFCGGLIIAKLICMVIFLIYPTQIAVVPEITGGGFAAFLAKILQKVDAPSTNLFPSIHCLESWFCLRIAFASEKADKRYKIASVIITFLVFVSVVTTKQHYIIDIPAGVLVAEIGLLISKKTGFKKLFYAADKKIRRKKI